MTNTLWKRVVEIICSVWLAIVTVQFFASYILRVEIDLSYAYVGMLFLMLASAGLRLVRRLSGKNPGGST